MNICVGFYSPVFCHIFGLADSHPSLYHNSGIIGRPRVWTVVQMHFCGATRENKFVCYFVIMVFIKV